MEREEGEPLPFYPHAIGRRATSLHCLSLGLSGMEVYHMEITACYSRRDARFLVWGTFHRGIGPAPG
jgi:hypothetical protein